MKRTVLLTTALLAFAAVPGVMADHMSPYGIGWADMPNDIHNTRLETRDEEDGNELFQDFVQGGEGATSINRCDVDPEFYDCYVDDPEL